MRFTKLNVPPARRQRLVEEQDSIPGFSLT